MTEQRYGSLAYTVAKLRRWIPTARTTPEHVAPDVFADDWYISAERFYQEMRAALPDLLAAAERAERLEAALDEYGEHRPECTWEEAADANGDPLCTCGLYAVLGEPSAPRAGEEGGHE